MFEMTNANLARLLRGLTIAVGNRKNRILCYQFLAAEIMAKTTGRHSQQMSAIHLNADK
jgi:hypothetical protein